MRIERAPAELLAPALGGLLNVMPTAQEPFCIVLEISASATVLDIIVQFGISKPHTTTVQF